MLVTSSWAASSNKFNLQPFKIDLSSQVSRMNALVKNTRLPTSDLCPEVGMANGIELSTLEQLKNDWVTSFDWDTQQAKLNQFAHFTAEIEGLTIHFIHEKSKDPNAIPLLMLHGWPGSFQEFQPVIEPLTQTWTNTTGGKNVSYNVVVPSLPGWDFSSPPANNSWTVHDTARLVDTLMTQVLGYPTYALHANDWGTIIGYDLYANYNTTVRAAHFLMIPFSPPTPDQIAAQNITLAPDQQEAEGIFVDWASTGNAYFTEQTTRPKTLGFAMYDNPVGQLSWMGWIWKNMSDPNAGIAPSQLTNTAILTSISLFYLTDTFYSSIYIYEQNPTPLHTVYAPPATDAPMFFSQFEFSPLYWPEEYIAKTGNLISYKFYDVGGHFPSWDNPPAIIGDVREMGLYYNV
ncbi:Alpha/Beta hydrolase protein [Roridomyces roridus]|uniref:Alpha/Beta hydrolase protein n=1 Tax=Roridomyces roridus TaxID=1738132 RepID=A0AAD7B2X9_9AGAR|nr:Alpha/Beta hydrolase protein [Roridomyces roridus]